MLSKLSTAFSLLEIDVEDDKQQTSFDTATKGNGKSSNGSNRDPTLSGNVNSQQSMAILTGEYKSPLVWINLEMTGPDIEVDRIIELACIVTDGHLTKSVEGPNLVIHQSKECMDKMGEWCQSHHGASGLTKKVLQSKITEEEAEKQVIEFVKKNVGACKQPLLAGNSVYVDLQFLKKYMPTLASIFPHILVDVSSISVLCDRWYPQDKKKAPKKAENHRALDDIKESIKELKYFKDNIFKPKPKNRKL